MVGNGFIQHVMPRICYWRNKPL